jgi:HD-GYP domain-containing protein (c-di-GMP phosphodiesterase class II)
MRLAHPVYDCHGEFLLKGGSVLTDGYISALQKRSIMTVYIEGVAIPEAFIAEQQAVIEETIRADAFAAIHGLMEKGDRNALNAVTASVESIMEELMAGKTAIGALTEISSTDSYTYAHSVDVCLLSLQTGLYLEYDKHRLLKLGVGCILHDLGKIETPIEILNKPGKLTETEFEIIKRHPHDGYQLAKKIQPDIDDSAASIIYRHHERHDGSGYPGGIKTGSIDEMSSICAIADVYNAMTSDRVYRKAIPSNEVYEYLMAAGIVIAGQRVRDAFLRCVNPFPVGSMVLLSTEEVGVVVETNAVLPLRPKVYVPRQNMNIDLQDELSTTILRILDLDDEAQRLIA